MNTADYMPLDDAVYEALGEKTPWQRRQCRAELLRLGIAWRVRGSRGGRLFVPRDWFEQLARLKRGAAAVGRVPRKNHVTA